MTEVFPRLLIVSQGIDGGIAPLSNALAEGLQKSGWHCSVVHVGRPVSSKLEKAAQPSGVEVRTVVTGKARSLAEIRGLLKSVWTLARLVRNEKPDAIICAGFIPALLYAALFKYLGTACLIFWSHGPQDTFLGIKKLLFPWALRHIDEVVCISGSTAASATEHFAISADRIRIIPNGIDPRRWQAVPPVSDWGSLRVLMPLRCDLNQKDPLTLIKAVALLRRRGVDIELTLAGTGIHTALVQQAIDAERQGNAIRLVPPTSDIPALMAQHNTVCLSTKFEGLPTVAIEGMLARRVVVASRVAGCIDVIRHNENGFLFEQGSVEDCAAKLDALRTHRDLPGVIRQAFEDASTTYTPSSMVEKFASLLNGSGCCSRT